MFDELAKILSKVVQEIRKLADELSRLFDSSSNGQPTIPFWKPYHCRVCGRRYAIPKEARLCVKLHQKGRTESKATARAYGKHANLRVTPRNREATMRSTEIRKHKQTAGGAGRR